jgi:hypothetical protein
MKIAFQSTNLIIAQNLEKGEYEVTIRIGGESITGRSPATCPRCSGPARPTLWEFEGPGIQNNNTIWSECAQSTPCTLVEKTFRWSKPVNFEDDWSSDE